MKVASLSVRDVRFPTARAGDGSDALNQGDYSATYVTLVMWCWKPMARWRGTA